MKLIHTLACFVSMLIGSSAFGLDTAGQTIPYDPSTTAGQVVTQDDQLTYDGRDVPLRIYLPESKEAAPILLFSHGLGGSREAGTYLGKHWAGRGYVVVMMQHAGSDIDVIRNAPRLRRFQALKEAASGANALARYNDVKATLDYLEKQTRTNGKYADRFDITKVGMSGHSFGAVTTQAVSGQNFKFRGQIHTDKRIDAAIALSPSIPAYGFDDQTFAKVNIPWMLMTGTEDASPIGRNTDAKSRRKVFQSLPKSGHFYELVLFEAKHSAFADPRAGKSAGRNPNHHDVIKSLSTAFWDSYLLGDEAALTWLNDSGAKSILESNDQWLKK